MSRRAGVQSLSSSPSSDDEDGGPGSSGIPLGGEGVWNSIFDELNDRRRGGVARDKFGLGTDGDDGGVEVGVEASEPIGLRAFCRRVSS